MKALVLREYGKLVYEEVEEPAIQPDEVLVEVKACGICGSDVHGMDGSTGRRIPPVIMGHEASGVVARVGPAVKGWKSGDRVSFDSMIWCGTCWHCRRGETNLCDDRRVLGVSCADYRCHGAFARSVAVPGRILVRMPADLQFDQAALGEPLAVAMHAVRIGTPRVGESVLVVGAGMIGLLVLQVLKASGCAPILVADIDRSKLPRAKDVGADTVLDSSAPDFLDRVRGETAGRGADCSFEAVGAGSALSAALSAVRKGGRVVMVGNLAQKVDFALQSAVTREITLLGSCASRGEYADSLELIARGRVRVEPLISARAPLSEGARWFERLYRREPGLMKVVLNP